MASAFLLGNNMIPFQKIGAFIVFDILISLLFAVLMFAAMLRLCGPKDGEQGSVRCICRRCEAATAGLGTGNGTKKKKNINRVEDERKAGGIGRRASHSP